MSPGLADSDSLRPAGVTVIRSDGRYSTERCGILGALAMDEYVPAESAGPRGSGFSSRRVATGVLLVLYVLVGVALYSRAVVLQQECGDSFLCPDIQILGLDRGVFLAAWLGTLFVAVALSELTRALDRSRPKALDARLARECPHCRELMRRDASVCLRCNRESQAWTPRGRTWVVDGGDGFTYELDERRGTWRRAQGSPRSAESRP